MTETLDTQRRKLAWRASRRGIKEMDLLVGGFAASELPGMSAEELEAFAMLLEIPDQQLLAWATQQEPVPHEQDSSMLRALLAFRPQVKA
jgi:antitoxin CptB